jgi:hypothetical protein
VNQHACAIAVVLGGATAAHAQLINEGAPVLPEHHVFVAETIVLLDQMTDASIHDLDNQGMTFALEIQDLIDLGAPGWEVYDLAIEREEMLTNYAIHLQGEIARFAGERIDHMFYQMNAPVSIASQIMSPAIADISRLLVVREQWEMDLAALRPAERPAEPPMPPAPPAPLTPTQQPEPESVGDDASGDPAAEPSGQDAGAEDPGGEAEAQPDAQPDAMAPPAPQPQLGPREQRRLERRQRQAERREAKRQQRLERQRQKAERREARRLQKLERRRQKLERKAEAQLSRARGSDGRRADRAMAKYERLSQRLENIDQAMAVSERRLADIRDANSDDQS